MSQAANSTGNCIDILQGFLQAGFSTVWTVKQKYKTCIPEEKADAIRMIQGKIVFQNES